MGVSDDLTTAAGHVAGLRRAVTALSKELGNTIDVQRLRDDVVRLADDVNLVRAEPESARRTAPAARARSSSSPTRSTTRRCGPTPRTRASATSGGH